jgi:hypothetical protein
MKKYLTHAVLLFASVAACFMFLTMPVKAQDLGAIVTPDGYVFDPVYYAKQNPDVVAVCGDSRLALYQHYLMSGRGEGRFGSASQADAVNAALASGETLTFAPMTLLGMESTPYDPTIDRATNVQVAADRLNGTLLQPGEKFSYDARILPRTAAYGYVPAGVIVNKQHAVGMGGGICQVSSTLYSAMVNAGIPATERHAHSLPVPYISRDREASISAGAMDLRFTNVLQNQLYIQAFYGDGFVTVMLIAM